MSRLERALVVVAALTASAGVARGHRLAASEFTAPVPLPAVLAGAGATVAVTAAWLARGGEGTHESALPTAGPPRADGLTPTAGPTRTVGTVPSTVSRPLRAGARALVFGVFVAVLAHGLLGRAVAAENLATLVAWPLLLKGVGLVAVVAGSPWRLISPWETLYDGLVALEGRPVALVGEYPSWLGAWPAVAGLVLGVGVVENLTVLPRSPAGTVAVAAGYAGVMVIGAAAFGREWFDRADALAVLFDLLGRVSVLAWTHGEDGSVSVGVRAPWAGATRGLGDTSLVVFVVATVYTVSFDGFTATRAYSAVLFDARAVLGVGTAGLTLYGLGLAAFVLGFYAVVGLVDSVGARAARARDESHRSWRRRTGESARAFGGTVVPIAAAYEVAHNYPFVAANLGGALTVARDLVTGTTGEVITPLWWLSVPAFWTSQVVLVVAGHLVAVVAAHRVATGRYGGAARRAHAPLVVLMVGYTALSLWIVSRPVVA